MRDLIEILTSFWPYFVSVLHIVFATAVTLHAVLRKPEANTVIAWVGLAWLTPVIGSIVYWCFGINRIQREATSLKIGKSLPAAPEQRLTFEDFKLRDQHLEKNPDLFAMSVLGENITGKQLLPGNKVTLLRDGDEAYPAMLEAINAATETVALLTYIFDSDPAGERFLEALKAARDRGVEVRVLIDAVGADYSKPNMVGRLRAEGINSAAFLPSKTPRLFRYANMRNHRKILVTDGRIGFTGGTNIRIGHWLGASPKAPVQCAHFKIEGPVVSHLREVFAMDWAFSAREVLPTDPWFPELERSAGVVGARGIAHGPDEDFEHITKVILGAIAGAQKHIRIASPYFLPDPPIVKALKVAALSGIKVDIVIPSDNNVPVIEWASVMQRTQLLEEGCHIYRSAPPFDHTKLMVLDDVWSLIGSTNWDPRSLRLNFEFNVECYNSELAQQLGALIDEKIAGGTPITLDQINARNLPVKLRDGIARLASPYL